MSFTLTIFLEDKKTGKYEKIYTRKAGSVSACAQISNMLLNSLDTKKYNVYMVIKAKEK